MVAAVLTLNSTEVTYHTLNYRYMSYIVSQYTFCSIICDYHIICPIILNSFHAQLFLNLFQLNRCMSIHMTLSVANTQLQCVTD